MKHNPYLIKKISRLCFGFLAVHLFWLAASLLLDTPCLPDPIHVYGGWSSLLASDILLHIAASLIRIAIGLALSFFPGIALGLLMAQYSIWNRFLSPIVYFTYPIPKTALLPVAMLLFGLGDRSKIWILVMTTVFPVIISVRDSAISADPSLFHAAKSAGAGTICLIKNITFPFILPELLTCLRLSLGTSLSVLFIIEAYGTRTGIGYYILNAWSRIDYLEMYGGIAAISLTGTLLFCLLDILSSFLCRWKI